MKKSLLSSALMIGIALGTLAANAAPRQVETGVVFSPSPGRVVGVYVEGCPGVIGSTTDWVARVMAHKRFAVASSTWGRPFTLTPALPAANLDIAFRKGTTFVGYSRSVLGGESGRVPVGATEAFVCLGWGSPTTFVYRAT